MVQNEIRGKAPAGFGVFSLDGILVFAADGTSVVKNDTRLLPGLAGGAPLGIGVLVTNPQLIPPDLADLAGNEQPRQEQREDAALSATSVVKFDDAEVVREFAISKDGTRVPMNIIRRKGTKLDGSNPTILYGYGGYGYGGSYGGYGYPSYGGTAIVVVPGFYYPVYYSGFSGCGC